ncbi:hypothetical protein FHG87_019781 [Trinorchestia longiramus]|nr:hypothetical protein FHG87_019781 [Trinorchestia longiramus]
MHHATFRDALRSMSHFAQRMIESPPCSISTPIKTGIRNAALMEFEHKVPFASASAARPASPGELQTCPGISSSARHARTQLENGVSGGPLTSTQVDDPKSNGNQEKKLVVPLLPELSQIITICDAEFPDRFLDETDIEFSDCPSPIIHSRTPRCNADKATEKIAGPSFISASELSRNLRSNDTLLTDISTPASKLANLMSVKLQTASPIVVNNEERKRKHESPNRKSPAKKECIFSIQSPMLSSPKSKQKNMQSLSAVVTTPSGRNEQETCYAVTPTKRTFEADQSPIPPSPDLFNSSGEQQLPSLCMPQLDADSPHDHSPAQQLDEKQKHVPLPQRPVKSPVTLTSDDSDMDDFDMNKSVRKSPELKRRVKEPAPRRKGVVFSKFK